MRAEYLVASRELCQELYAVAGDKVETYFCWMHSHEGWAWNIGTSKHVERTADMITVPAYDSVVLQSMLPQFYATKRLSNDAYFVCPQGLDPDKYPCSATDKNVCNALIRVVIDLLKEGIVKAEDLG